MPQRILNVGQCGYDHGNISRVLESHFDVEVAAAHDAEHALTTLQQQQFALILVNRKFDSDGDDGVSFIKQLQQDSDTADVPVMLVSNHDDAQQSAVAAGARLGFGKAALNSAETLARLRTVLAE